jgi:hypothetical protein
MLSRKSVIMLALVMVLCACGGGGNQSTPTPTAGGQPRPPAEQTGYPAPLVFTPTPENYPVPTP